MPVLTAETLDQELSVLLIAQDSWLSKEIARFFLEQEVAVKQTPIAGEGATQFIQLLLEKNHFFKIVVVINDPDTIPLDTKELLTLLEYISSFSIPKIFIVGLVSVQQSQKKLVKKWQTQSQDDKQVLEFLSINEKQNKLLLGQDLIGHEKIALSHAFLTAPIVNGFLLDPQLETTPLLVEDFFQAIKKELLRPKTKNILVRGSTVASEKILVELRTFLRNFYARELSIIDYSLSTCLNFFSGKESELIETIVGSDLTNVIKRIADISIKNTKGLSQKLLTEVLPHSPLLVTKPSNPFKNQGTEFEFEPPLHRGDDLSSESSPVLHKQKKNSLEEGSKQNNQEKLGQQSQQDVLENSSASDLEKEEPQQHLDFEKEDIHYLNDISSKNNNDAKMQTDPKSVGESEPSLLDFTPLDDQLSKLFKTHRTHQKTERRKEKATLIAKIKRKSRNKQIIFFLGAFALSLGLLLGTSFLTLTLNFRFSEKKLQQKIVSFLEGQTVSSKSLWVLQVQTTVLDTLFDTPTISSSKFLLEVESQLRLIDQEISKLNQINRLIYQSIIQTDKNTHLANLTPTSMPELSHASSPPLSELVAQQDAVLISIAQTTDKLNSILGAANLKYLSVDTQASLQQLPDFIKKLESNSQVLRQINPILEEIVAVNAQKHYYLLLQDNLEIRPTGGFLQAVAALVVENGQLIDYQVYSIDELDAKQPGAIRPPPEVEAYLGEKQLYLRDANWDPDFSTSAKQIAWFLRESLNQPVDGIIALNYSQVKELMVVLGSINVEEYSVELTPNNLFSRLETLAFAEKKQTNQDTIHVQILAALLAKMAEAQPEQIEQLQGVFLENLRQQQMSIFFANPQLGGVFSQLGWTGSLIQPECPTRFGGGCYKDYLYQVEANIGVNKVNQHILSRVNHSIKITPERVEHTRQIKYTNNAQSPSWPLGLYKTYLRFYVNAESIVAGVMVNKESIDSQHITEYLDHNRKVIGVVVAVPIESEIEVVIKYHTPHQIKNGESYFYFEQSQPGVMNRLSSIALTHPDDLRALLISPLVEVNQNQVVVTSDQGVGFLAIQFAEE